VAEFKARTLDPDKDILLALEGRPLKCPVDYHYRLRDLPNVFKVLRDMRLRIIANRQGAAVDLIEYLETMYDEEDALHLARAACYLARRRLDYWGIEDPDNEWWCSYCKQVLPKDKFEVWETSLCEDCAARKRRHRRRADEEIQRRKTYAESRSGDPKSRCYTESRYADLS
jgi:hypothetical protein